MIRVVIVDDHDLVREGIRALLEQDPAFEVVGETGDGQEAIRLARRLRPDVLLMDVSLPGGIGGLEATETIVADCPGSKVIILTQYENREYIKRAIRIGARGYLLKRSVAAQLKEAIKTVHAGQRYLHPLAAEELVDLVTTGKSLEEDDYDRLTPREKQVFKLLAEGKTSREISKYLTISLKTAMTHRTNIMTKLAMHSRAELIRYAIRKAIIPVEGP
ncbi:MAG: response regulator transcription factor [Candidatus Rokubacteria bacterium]|nr:response regulator transcription factor [Candidatus Rokubacteria bacterium]